VGAYERFWKAVLSLAKSSFLDENLQAVLAQLTK